MDQVKCAVIGLGSRGYSILEWLLLKMDNVRVTAVCDKYQDRMERGVDSVLRAYGEKPFASTDYREVLDSGKAEAVFILSSWDNHIPAALYAMERHVATAIEVGGAYKLEDCWNLVRTQQRTGTPFMFLENCCFGETEMLVLNMVRQGLFGDVMACSGGYMHDLRGEITHGRENRHYRLENYLGRNCENYPTHELGPIAMVLNINRGNLMTSLVSMGTASRGLNEYARRCSSVDKSLATAHFAQADIVETLISCAGGQVIRLTLDTTLPRYYSRGFTVHGTKALFSGENNTFFMDRTDDQEGELPFHMNNHDEFAEKYRHPVWKKYIAEGVRGGHDGMDGLVYDRFVECVRLGLPCPIDVYDAAAWMAITPLSEWSLAHGSAPVEIPDFTEGKWKTAKPVEF
ncbi:MAG: Gfo/Idh/MocA family oxidoreductase [Clostridia bacterium]|nr:Gfo/Idh/MocA family oxidoreductase [Clostridia bacterium]